MNERYDDHMQYFLKTKFLRQLVIKVDKTIMIISTRIASLDVLYIYK